MSTIIAVVITLCVVAPITWAVATAHRKNAYESKIGTAEEKAKKKTWTKKQRTWNGGKPDLHPVRKP